MSLDNRPTSLLVSALPDDTNEGALRAHFLPFGELTHVEFPSITTAVVQFADRFRAEAALSGGKMLKGQKLQMTWYNPAAPKTAQESLKTPATEAEKEKESETSTVDLSSSSASIEQDSEPYGHFDDEEEDTERSWKH